MAITGGTMKEIERKAQAGIAMSNPSADKIAAYNRFNPTNSIYNKPAQPTQQSAPTLSNKPTQPVQKFEDPRSPSSSRDPLPSLSPTLDQKKEPVLDGWKGISNEPSSFLPKPPQSQSQDLINKYAVGLGKDVDFGFSNWNNLNSVQEQLRASATAMSSLSREGNVNADQAQELYDHFLRLGKQANALGDTSITSPMYDSQSMARGFGTNGSIQDQWKNVSQASNQMSLEDEIMKQLDTGTSFQVGNTGYNIDRMKNDPEFLKQVLADVEANGGKYGTGQNGYSAGMQWDSSTMGHLKDLPSDVEKYKNLLNEKAVQVGNTSYNMDAVRNNPDLFRQMTADILNHYGMYGVESGNKPGVIDKFIDAEGKTYTPEELVNAPNSFDREKVSSSMYRAQQKQQQSQQTPQQAVPEAEFAQMLEQMFGQFKIGAQQSGLSEAVKQEQLESLQQAAYNNREAGLANVTQQTASSSGQMDKLNSMQGSFNDSLQRYYQNIFGGLI